MELKRVSPTGAKKLAEEEGYTLLDVRSMPEFSEGHPADSVNIPFLHKTPQGMIPNQDFDRIVEFRFPEPDAKIVTFCQMGGRSVRAAQQLMARGYTNVVDMQGGFGGERDEAGKLIHPGWQDENLATDQGEPEGRSYKSINNAANAARRDDSAAAVPPPAGQAGLPSQYEPGMNRFASANRQVFCAVLKKELPGLKRRPYPGELGQRIFDSVSAQAWDNWVEHSKMIINEYRINSADPNAIKLLMEQCEQFLFGGDGVARPEGYVPQ